MSSVQDSRFVRTKLLYTSLRASSSLPFNVVKTTTTDDSFQPVITHPATACLRFGKCADEIKKHVCSLYAMPPAMEYARDVEMDSNVWKLHSESPMPTICFKLEQSAGYATPFNYLSFSPISLIRLNGACKRLLLN